MSTASEIEEAIRTLPASEREKLLQHIPVLFPELAVDAEWERIIQDERPRPGNEQAAGRNRRAAAAGSQLFFANEAERFHGVISRATPEFWELYRSLAPDVSLLEKHTKNSWKIPRIPVSIWSGAQRPSRLVGANYTRPSRRCAALGRGEGLVLDWQS